MSDTGEAGNLTLWSPLLGAEFFQRLERGLLEGERGRAVAGLVGERPGDGVGAARRSCPAAATAGRA